MDNVTPEDEDFPGRLLHQAALWDNAELLEDLLHGDQVAYINSQDSWGRTPLHAAATTENSRCLHVLLRAGANPNIPCGPRGENRTPLHVSSEHGYVENVKCLLEHRADLVARDNNGLTPLDIAEKGDHMECMQILKEAADCKEAAREKCHATLLKACSQGDLMLVKNMIQELGKEAELIINMAPNGSNTLLFTACEVGQKEIVKVLLEHGADGRIHPVTRYSPLYIASYYGKKDIVEMILKKFPELVQLATVEKWLPIHAACINRHVAVMDLLLSFPYPPHILQRHRDQTGTWEYELPFDLNMRDVTGQTVLYLSCYFGNQKMVDLLLRYKVKARRVKVLEDKESAKSEDEEDSQKESGEVLSPTRRKISEGIQSIMSKLNISRVQEQSLKINEAYLSPLFLDLYCNNNTETALHIGVKHKHHSIVSALLLCGANPNLPIYQSEEEFSQSQDDETVFIGSIALVEACKNRDLGMVDLLLKYSARDDECKALRVATSTKDEILITKLLSIKAYQDPEYKINKKAMTDIHPSQFSGLGVMGIGSLTYSSLFPNTPVMVNWHGQRGLDHIKLQWLVDAALNVNPKLKLNPRNHDIVLFSITRLDISNNSLCSLPIIVFQLQSLKYLNVAQNKIENYR